MTSPDQLACSREGCHPELGEGCIEGLEVAECPHRNGFVVPAEPPGDADENVGSEAEFRTVRVHNGDALTTIEADLFLRKTPATVVAVVGCPNAGKTTAAAMLYELLKRERLEGYSFAGSRTIRGFQSRSFWSLLVSGLEEPDTERTKGSKPVEFLHLRVVPKAGSGAPHNILIADRTGEDFERCMNKPDLCASFPEISRADYHVLLVDGKKLVDDNLAALHSSEVLRIYLSLIRTPVKRLQLVLTKYDKVRGSEKATAVLERFAECETDLRKRLPSGTELTTHLLAARPSMAEENADLLGHGLQDLIKDWLSEHVTAVEFHKQVPKLLDGRPVDLLINTVGGEI